MKIIAATSERTVLVEIHVTELRHITEWNGMQYGNSNIFSDAKPGTVIELTPMFKNAAELVGTFRGIAPDLRSAAAKVLRMAETIELHEPDVSLLPKTEG